RRKPVLDDAELAAGFAWNRLDLIEPDAHAPAQPQHHGVPEAVALLGRKALVGDHGHVHRVGFILHDLEADDAFGVLGAVADVAQVDVAVLRRPDEVGAASVNVPDHRKARPAGAAVVVRSQADAVADAVTDQRRAARGESGDE